MKIIDISTDTLTTSVYPGDPEPRVQKIKSIEKGDDCNLSVLYSCVHTGTHCDAPLHFIEDGESIESGSLERFIGPCAVIQVREGPITGELVNNYFPHNCERLLIKGEGKAWFAESGAEEAAALGIKLIGTDANSVGTSGNQIKPHKAFLREDIAVLEGLDLSEVEPGKYFLISLPVKLSGLEAAPARAVLVKDYIFWGGKG